MIAASKTITVNAVAKTATTNFTYDAADHFTATQYPDSESVVTAFDHGGQARATGLSANCPTTTYVCSILYDLFGRPTTVVHGNTTDSREYYGPPGPASFPDDHRLKRLWTTAGSSTYLDLRYTSYTLRGLLSGLADYQNPGSSDPLSNTAAFTYDFLGRLTGAVGPNLPYGHGRLLQRLLL